MLAYGGDDDGGALGGGFGEDEPCERTAVRLIEVADRLVEEEEVEGLTERADSGKALLLPEGQQACRALELVGDTECLEVALDSLAVLVPCELVLDPHVVPSR